MHYLAWVGLLWPLLGFICLFLGASWIGRKGANLIGCSSIALSFICFFALLISCQKLETAPFLTTLFTWIPVEGIQAEFTLLIDPLSLLMAGVVTGVGFLIHCYSVGYIEHEEDYCRFFACMNYFVFSMLLLVLAGHLLVLFVGWEGVGLASYLLIGYWYTRPAAAEAATKAFVVNRIADFGFLIGLLLVFYTFGTGDYGSIFKEVSQNYTLGAPILTFITLLLLAGAVGKSAQLPLYTWLPDAMEGPTPVSALIHAATMVTAGVYLIVRMHPLFLLSPFTMEVVGALGAATALFAAVSALGQTDLKRVLAFSTISQLGYMFLACGVGAFYPAMFHLTAHAFMKALLFLSAGNIVHMMGTTDMGKMGGLSKTFRKTQYLFLIGVLAMSGIPPFVAFFSKDLILEQAKLAGFQALYWVGLVTAILTAVYLTRAYCLTFLGKLRVDEKVMKTVKEAPPIMLLPTAVLAFCSITGGILGVSTLYFAPLKDYLSQVGVGLAVIPKETLWVSPYTWLSVITSVVAILCTILFYSRFTDALGKPPQFLIKSFFVNEIYQFFVVDPAKALSSFIGKIVEPKFFVGMVDLLGKAAFSIAKYCQRMQSGQIRSYAAWIAAGAGILLFYLVR